MELADDTGAATIALWGNAAVVAKENDVMEISKIRVRLFDNQEKRLTTTKATEIQVITFVHKCYLHNCCASMKFEVTNIYPKKSSK